MTTRIVLRRLLGVLLIFAWLFLTYALWFGQSEPLMNLATRIWLSLGVALFLAAGLISISSNENVLFGIGLWIAIVAGSLFLVMAMISN